jgi:hypothetical protein
MPHGMIDVNRLQGPRFYGDNKSVELGSFAHGLLTQVVNDGIRFGRYKHTDTVGFAMMNPGVNPIVDWNDPSEIGWLVGGFGLGYRRYIANAARKLRPLAREGEGDTLSMTLRSRSPFRDVITPEQIELEKSWVAERPDQGVFHWGDFGYGGAVTVTVGDVMVSFAISGLTQQEDHVVASYIANEVALLLWKLEHPES